MIVSIKMMDIIFVEPEEIYSDGLNEPVTKSEHRADIK